jgi:hypothetical protein
MRSTMSGAISPNIETAEVSGLDCGYLYDAFGIDKLGTGERFTHAEWPTFQRNA